VRAQGGRRRLRAMLAVSTLSAGNAGDIGYFFSWYSSVEWKITNLMALVMGEKDFSAFDLLVSGMDGKQKTRRLLNLCKIKNWQSNGPS
jgi:hypothetical protein